MNLLAVFLGGGIGSVLRYLCSVFFSKNVGITYPWGTFCVNILGSLFLGFVFGALLVKVDAINTQTKLFLTVGVAGGFTTFSTFSVETFNLFKQGHTLIAIVYPLSSILLGFGAVALGFYFARYI